MGIGTVKFFTDERGYGFIRPDDNTADAFVHIRVVQQAGYSSLATGQRVSFTMGVSPKSNRACVAELTVLDPILSPPIQPRTWHPDEPDEDEHQRLAEQSFLKQSNRVDGDD